MRTILAVMVAACALGTGCSSGAAAGPSAPLQLPPRASPPLATAGSPAASRVPGEYLVTLAPGADAKAIEAVYGSLGVKRVQDLGGSLYLVTVGEDPGPERMEALRAKDARIQAVQPNLVYRANPRGPAPGAGTRTGPGPQ